MSRDAKLDLRTCIALAPNMQVAPKALAALAHPGKSPVAGPLTTSEDLGRHTYAIIAHPDRKIGTTKRNLDLYMASLRMLVRVADRFANDAISLVTNDNTQVSGPTL